MPLNPDPPPPPAPRVSLLTHCVAADGDAAGVAAAVGAAPKQHPLPLRARAVNANAVEARLLGVAVAVLACGMAFQSGAVPTGTGGHWVLVVVLAALVLGSILACLGLLALEVREAWLLCGTPSVGRSDAGGGVRWVVHVRPTPRDAVCLCVACFCASRGVGATLLEWEGGGASDPFRICFRDS